MSSEPRESPVFICGHPKSGTSLLRAVFDSHPQLIVYPEETIFFRRFLPQAVGKNLEDQLSLADKTLINIFEWNKFNPVPSQEGFPDRDYSSISFLQVQRIMREYVQQRYRHPGDILSAAILAYGLVSNQAGPEVLHWVEKSPYNEYHTEDIFGWWPAAKCLHIIRDPRDNYNSYVRKHPDWSAEFFASNWKHSTNAGIQNARKYGLDRYLLLRFEDLTQAPLENIHRAVEFLAIDWNATLVSPSRAGDNWAGNSMFSERFQGISAQPVARWKQDLDLKDSSVIELLTSKLMNTFSYPIESLRDLNFFESLSVRVRTWSWPFRRRLKN